MKNAENDFVNLIPALVVVTVSDDTLDVVPLLRQEVLDRKRMFLFESQRKYVLGISHQILVIDLARLEKRSIKEAIPQLLNSIGLKVEIDVFEKTKMAMAHARPRRGGSRSAGSSQARSRPSGAAVVGAHVNARG
jgi:hypothetical protein